MEPILLNVPDELFTERLHLRVPRPGDGPLVADSVLASLPELKPWMPWATDRYRVEDSEMWCRRAAGHFLLREQFAYRISLKGSDAHLGNLSAHRVDWKIQMAEIGYWLRTDEQGHGYMTEAVTALTNLLGSIGLRRIEVRCDVENKKSAAVPPRCGYQLEGTFRSDALDPAGKPRSTFIFAKVSNDVG